MSEISLPSQIILLDNQETFIPVKDHPKYLLSNLGRVWNIHRESWVFGTVDARHGYVRIKFLKDGKIAANPLLHRVVAEHFIPNPLGKKEVNHLGEKIENMACMLEWATRKENMVHAHKNIIKVKTTPIQKMDPVTGIVLKTYKTLTSTELDGYNSMSIHRTLLTDLLYKGYRWKYVQEPEPEKIIDGEKWYHLKDSIYKEVNIFDKYKVSDMGRIRGWFGRLLEINYSNGIGTIKLSNDTITICIKVHRLVMMACNIPNPDNKPEVDHIDSDCCNNVLSNLRWSTKKEQTENPNTLKKFLGPRVRNIQTYKITHHSVEQICLDIELFSLKKGIAIFIIEHYCDTGKEYYGYKFEKVAKPLQKIPLMIRPIIGPVSKIPLMIKPIIKPVSKIPLIILPKGEISIC